MKLGYKLRYLSAVEGSLRGLGRSMTQQELATAMKNEIGRGLSQAYLSQIENGARPHLTHTTRQLLARFFRVYPGFLVDDPEGYTPGLQSELRAIDAKIDRKSTRLNSSHSQISYAVFCLKKKKKNITEYIYKAECQRQ